MRNALLLLISCSIIASAREEFRKDFSRTAPIAAGRSVRIEHQFGRVRVRVHPRNEVQINAVIRCSAPTAEEARRHAEDVRIVVEQNASGVSVRTTYPSSRPRNISYNADYEILMPAASPLEVRNRFGEIDVAGLHAPATLHGGNGPLSLSGGRGAQRVENSFGTVDVRNADGDVTINNGNGRVTVAGINGELDVTNRFDTTAVSNVSRGVTIHSNNGAVTVDTAGGPVIITNSFNRVVVTDAKSDVRVQNQNGEIVATGVAGAAELRTSFSNINFARIGRGLTAIAQNTQIRGDTVAQSAILETTFGGIDVRGVKGGARVTAGNSSVRLSGIGGAVTVKDTFGPVELRDVGGAVTVENQNGSILVDGIAPGACRPLDLRTAFGQIRVTMPRTVGYNVSARTSFGRIHTEGVQLAVSGDISQDNVNGRIGAGGCDLHLQNQNGGIDIVGR